MTFIPNTDSDRKQMLATIGVNSFDELIAKIPQSVRLNRDLNLMPKLSEYEIVKLLSNYAGQNASADKNICFMGGGSYDHFIPTVVSSVLERPEFKTAYTPYQAEVSQGTLQVMYEFQSMITDLTGMDVSNASMYDGASSLAEACLLSNLHNKRANFLIAGTLNSNYRKVIDTVTSGRKLQFKECKKADGSCDLDALNQAVDKTISAIIVQQPNAFGYLEDVHEIEKIAHANGCLFIVVADPISLGLLQAPGEYNADIMIAEGQSLGIPMSFGGPYLGIFATKNEFVRKVPGRLSGETVDLDGKRGFVLTLQTREQQIKREKATSNICTNQGLFMLAATVYMASMGKEGIREVAEQCYERSHYLASAISALPGYKLFSDRPFFKEFLVSTPADPKAIIDEGVKNGILAGISVHELSYDAKGLLIAVTEKRSKEDMDSLVALLKKFAK